MSRVFKILASLLLVMLFTTCKKYPENNLWFKSPEKAFKGGEIIAYMVDGIDSIPMWNTIYSTAPYNGYGTNITVENFIFNTKGNVLLDSNIGGGSFHFFNHKKYISISFTMTNNPWNPQPQYYFFGTKDSDWKVLKLTSNGDMRIQRTYNNKVYEIEFKH